MSETLPPNFTFGATDSGRSFLQVKVNSGSFRLKGTRWTLMHLSWNLFFTILLFTVAVPSSKLAYKPYWIRWSSSCGRQPVHDNQGEGFFADVICGRNAPPCPLKLLEDVAHQFRAVLSKCSDRHQSISNTQFCGSSTFRQSPQSFHLPKV